MSEQKLLSHILELATRAHSGTSFSPEKRGQSIVNEYSAELAEDLNAIRLHATKNNVDIETMEADCTRYQQNYEKHLTAYLHSRTGLMSSMITGPARFPVARMEKLNRWSDNKHTAFREWRERAQKAIFKSYTPTVDPLEKAQKELQQCESNQKIYKEINKAIRKHKGKPEAQVQALVAIGVKEETARKFLSPDFAGRIGIPSYKLTNNNANIKRLQQRVKELQQKQVNAETKGQEIQKHGDIEIIHNHSADRLQLIFPSKPAPEVIALLKKHAFKWSPTNKAWQRQLTNNALYVLKDVLKQIPV